MIKSSFKKTKIYIKYKNVTFYPVTFGQRLILARTLPNKVSRPRYVSTPIEHATFSAGTSTQPSFVSEQQAKPLQCLPEVSLLKQD